MPSSVGSSLVGSSVRRRERFGPRGGHRSQVLLVHLLLHLLKHLLHPPQLRRKADVSRPAASLTHLRRFDSPPRPSSWWASRSPRLAWTVAGWESDSQPVCLHSSYCRVRTLGEGGGVSLRLQGERFSVKGHEDEETFPLFFLDKTGWEPRRPAGGAIESCWNSHTSSYAT